MGLFTTNHPDCENCEYCEKKSLSCQFYHVLGPNVCIHSYYSYIFYFPKANPFYFNAHKLS